MQWIFLKPQLKSLLMNHIYWLAIEGQESWDLPSIGFSRHPSKVNGGILLLQIVTHQGKAHWIRINIAELKYVFLHASHDDACTVSLSMSQMNQLSHRIDKANLQPRNSQSVNNTRPKSVCCLQLWLLPVLLRIASGQRTESSAGWKALKMSFVLFLSFK